MAYTDKSSIENYLQKNINSSFDTQITAWIAAVTQYINQRTGRNFEADSTASTRLYATRYAPKLLIDDCVEITKVEIGDTYGDSFTETTDYVALPLNDTPKNVLALKFKNWNLGTHRVTAKWGYSVSVPDDIQLAATILAAGIANASLGTGTAKVRERIGGREGYEVMYSDDRGLNDFARVDAILAQYAKLTL